MPPLVLYSVEITESTLRVTLDSRDQTITFERLVAALRLGRQQQGHAHPHPTADPIFQFTDEDTETISFSSQREIGEVLRAAKRMNDRRKQQQTIAEGQAATGGAAQHSGAQEEDDEVEIVPLHIRVLQTTNQPQVRSPFDRTAKRGRRDSGSETKGPTGGAAIRIRLHYPAPRAFVFNLLLHPSARNYSRMTLAGIPRSTFSGTIRMSSELQQFDSALCCVPEASI